MILDYWKNKLEGLVSTPLSCVKRTAGTERLSSTVKKKKEPIISKKKIKRMKRSDGLKMKLVGQHIDGTGRRMQRQPLRQTHCASNSREEGSEPTHSELKRKSDAISLYFLEQGFVKGGSDRPHR